MEKDKSIIIYSDNQNKILRTKKKLKDIMGLERVICRKMKVVCRWFYGIWKPGYQMFGNKISLLFIFLMGKELLTSLLIHLLIQTSYIYLRNHIND